ncbi:hypothetical protein BDY24DRAFT_416537 [Mrakia frigida]|uniref:uncharacterized protein n=1 Tax=Mrakia frigida TaxID=29902 RepID=UPI003FCC0628
MAVLPNPAEPSSSSNIVSGKRKRNTTSMYEGNDDDEEGGGQQQQEEEEGDEEDVKGKGKGKKKAKGSKKEQKEPEEKRMARFRKACPKAVMERADRVRSQRMFLVDRTREGDELMEEFKILGSTGNVYTITIGLTPTCSCPDSAKNGTCKHIIFAFLKVLCVPLHSTIWYQKALLTTELADVFASAPPNPVASALASANVRSAYRKAEGMEGEADKFGDLKGMGGVAEKKMPEEGDDCPICYDDLSAKDPALTFCLAPGGCGRALHNECLGQWIRTQKGLGKEVTCVWCRAAWSSSAGAGGQTLGGGGASSSQGGIYTNLAAEAGMSSTRDVSSYYMGPRRGESYNSYTVSQRARSYQNGGGY